MTPVLVIRHNLSIWVTDKFGELFCIYIPIFNISSRVFLPPPLFLQISIIRHRFLAPTSLCLIIGQWLACNHCLHSIQWPVGGHPLQCYLPLWVAAWGDARLLGPKEVGVFGEQQQLQAARHPRGEGGVGGRGGWAEATAHFSSVRCDHQFAIGKALTTECWRSAPSRIVLRRKREERGGRGESYGNWKFKISNRPVIVCLSSFRTKNLPSLVQHEAAWRRKTSFR